MRTRWFTILLLLAIALGLALRAQDLGRESLWADEVNQFWGLDKPFGSFLADRWTLLDPPLNDVIAWGWNAVVRAWAPTHATDEAVIRTPVVVFGVAAIAAAALVARAAFGPVAGVVAAFVLATNPYHVRYSQEARMHALVPLLAMVAMLFLVRTLARGRSRDALWFGVLSAVAVYAHYFALLPLAAATVATLVLWARTREARLRVLLRGELIGLALCVPYLAAQVMYAGVSHHGYRPWLKKLGPPTYDTLLQTGRVYVGHSLDAVIATAPLAAIDGVILAAAIAALALLLVLGTAVTRADEPVHLRAHLLAIVVGAFGAVFLVSQVRPVFHARYMLATFPALLLLLVRARPVWLVALGALFPIALGTLVAPRYHALMLKPDYREAAAVLLHTLQPGDVVTADFLDRRPLQHYARLAASRESPVVQAIDRSWDYTRTPADILEIWKQAIAAGRDVYEIDVLRVSFRLTAEALARRLETPHDAARELVFESRPLPYIRIWRRDTLPSDFSMDLASPSKRGRGPRESCTLVERRTNA